MRVKNCTSPPKRSKTSEAYFFYYRLEAVKKIRYNEVSQVFVWILQISGTDLVGMSISSCTDGWINRFPKAFFSVFFPDPWFWNRQNKLLWQLWIFLDWKFSEIMIDSSKFMLEELRFDYQTILFPTLIKKISSYLRAYLNGKLFVNIFANFLLIFHLFYKENGASSLASLRKSQIFFKIFSFSVSS